MSPKVRDIAGLSPTPSCASVVRAIWHQMLAPNLCSSMVPLRPWNCKISLHKKFVYEGNLGKNAIKLSGVTRGRPLGPWALQDSEEFHFATLTSKDGG